MLHNPGPTFRRSLAGLLLVLAVAACGIGAQAGAGNAGGATIGVAAPADGAQVSVPFGVQLESSVPLGEPETGNHHAHLYFDTDTDSGDYDILYGTSWQVTRSLAPGTHTITVALANPDHSLAGPTQSITITVGGGPGGGSDPAPTPSASGPLY